jgi:hypothetical protein
MSVDREVSPLAPDLHFAAGAGTLRRLACVAAYVVLGAFTLSPLLSAAVPPLVDYPDHLARIWVLLHAQDIPALASNYVVDWRLLPNLAVDLVLPLIAHVLPLEAAGRLFIALTMASLVLGSVALQRVLHGRVGFWPLASLLFVYNSVLYWGFVNFLFTLGLALLAFAAWVASERWPAWRRVAVFALPAGLLFVFHLFGFGVYGLLVGSYEFGRWLPQRRSTRAFAAALISLAQFVPAGAMWLATLGNGGTGYTRLRLDYKVMDIVAPTTFSWQPAPFDLALLIAGIFLLFYAKASGAFRLAPRMRWPIAAMIVTAIIMPDWLSGSWAADLRLPIALAFVLVGATAYVGTPRAPIAAVAALALVLLGVRVWTVTQSWRDADRRFAEFRAASRVLPDGARLLVVEVPLTAEQSLIDGVSPLLAHREPMTFWHMPALAVIDRAAFVPYLFFTGWTPLRPNPRNDGLYQPHGRPLLPDELVASAAADWRPSAPDWPDMLGEMPYWVGWKEKFDFVLRIDFGGHTPAPLPAILQPWASGSFFQIYRVIR